MPRFLVPLVLALLFVPAVAFAAAPPAPPASPAAPQAGSGEHVIPITFATSGPQSAPKPVRPTVPAAPQRFTNPAKDVGAFVLVIVVAFLLLWAILIGVRGIWRRRSRKCPECGRSMPHLEAAAAYEHLDLAERTEQLVGDVRYEVWACPGCGHVEKSSRVRQSAGSVEALAPVGSATYLRQQQRDGLSILPTDLPTETPPPGPTGTGA